MASKSYVSPTRTIMIMGFKSQEELSSYRETVKNTEDLIDTYSVAKSNLLFIIFNDIRNSITFFNNNKTSRVLSYAVSKYELPKSNEVCSSSNFQSTVTFKFDRQPNAVDDFQFLSYLSKYAEVRDLKVSEPFSKVVEFYKIRDAESIFLELNNTGYDGGSIICNWTWDLSFDERVNYISSIESFIKDNMNKPHENIKVRMTVEDKKYPIIALFDRFIFENIDEIEKNIN